MPTALDCILLYQYVKDLGDWEGWSRTIAHGQVLHASCTTLLVFLPLVEKVADFAAGYLIIIIRLLDVVENDASQRGVFSETKTQNLNN